MRSFMLTFISDDVEKMRIFGALLDAGMKEFVITETEQFTYDNWKKDVNCEENEATTDDDHSCVTCEWYTDGRCLKDCEKHEWFDYCSNHKPKAATTNDHFRDARKMIDLVEE